MNRQEIMRAGRKELVAWLEGVRGMQCYDSETLKELRECAIDDLPAFREEQRTYGWLGGISMPRKE